MTGTPATSDALVRLPRGWRYAVAPVSVCVAAAIRLSLDPLLPHRFAYLSFPLAVVISSRLAGVRAGLAATAISGVLASFLFLEPRYTFGLQDPLNLVSLAAYLAVSAGLAIMVAPREPKASPIVSAERTTTVASLRRALLLAGTFLLLFGVSRLLYSDFGRTQERRRWVAHAYEVMNSTKELSAILQQAEVSQADYLLTGDEHRLSGYESAVADEPGAFYLLRRLVADNPAQAQRMEQLNRLVESRLGTLEKGISARRHATAAGPVVLEGLAEADQIRDLLLSVAAEEQRLLGERSAAGEEQATSMRWVLGLGTASLLLLLVIAGGVIEYDAQERERSRRALALSEQTTRSLLEAAPQAIIGTDQDGRILLMNPVTERLFGYTREELSGQLLESLIPERLREAHRQHWGEFRQAPRLRQPDARAMSAALRKDGTEFPVEIGIAGVETPARLLYVAYINDVTERERAAEAVRKSEQDLRRYMESAPAAIATFDREMRYLAVSRRFLEDYHLGSADLRGRCHYEVFPEMSERWRAVHRRCLEGVVERNEGERFLRADGTEQWIRWEIQPWYETSGAVGGIVLLSEDITAQRMAQDEVRRLNESLEDRVRERTLQLEFANAELEAFSYSVSHDLRAPLRGIDGWSLALLEDYGDQLDSRAQQYLQRVRSETTRLGELVDGMLRLSRISRAEGRQEPVDLTKLATNITGRLTEAEPGRKLEFTIQQGLTALGDRDLLEIALTNLLANAVKFTMPTEKAVIEFGLQGSGGQAVYFVRDNGVGFDMAFAGMLFGAFQRLHKPSQFPGTGIGLATVRRVVCRHGGRVWAEAHPDSGATFYFTLGGAA